MIFSCTFLLFILYFFRLLFSFFFVVRHQTKKIAFFCRFSWVKFTFSVAFKLYYALLALVSSLPSPSLSPSWRHSIFLWPGRLKRCLSFVIICTGNHLSWYYRWRLRWVELVTEFRWARLEFRDQRQRGLCIVLLARIEISEISFLPSPHIFHFLSSYCYTIIVMSWLLVFRLLSSTASYNRRVRSFFLSPAPWSVIVHIISFFSLSFSLSLSFCLNYDGSDTLVFIFDCFYGKL